VLTWNDIELLTVSRRQESWRALRRMRAQPPAMAGRDPQRRRTFQAALEQAEQFLRSAETAGYETKPVQVFYGLSQAGRAIAAASAHVGEAEYRPIGHGMRTLDTRDQTDLWQVAVEISKAGTPQTVAQALGSPIWPPKARLTLAQLWPLIPETAAERPASAELSELVALRYLSQSPPTGPWELATLCGVPWKIYEQHEQPEAVAAWLSHYPTLAGWHGGTSSHEQHTPRLEPHGGEVRTRLLWPAPSRHDGPVPADWVRRATQYRGGWWTLPALAGMTAPVTPLLVWWAVLLALSSLARYEPEAWAGIIDVDGPGSPAVAVEHFLDAALDVIPELVSAALAHVSFCVLDDPA
jgi:hypothetical protein